MPTDTNKPLTDRELLYAQALDVQNACNGIAIINTLARLAPQIKAECNGTDEFNRHAIVQLFLSKLVSLAGGDFDPGHAIWDTCNRFAGRAPKEIE